MADQYLLANGLLSGADQCPSSNFNYRPHVPISLLVIHNISLPAGNFGTPYIEQLFTNSLDSQAHASFCDLENLHVSAHLLIKRDGRVIQFVNFEHRAWHAGVSSYGDKSNCNDFSIGIELEGVDDIAYSVKQYQALIKVTRTLIKAYPSIGINNIVGHSDIAPQRKSDPGVAFDWQYYRQQLTQ